MPDKQSHRRIHYFVKREFQSGFIFKFCLLVLIGTLLSTSLLLLFSQDTLTSSFHQSRLQIENTSLAILPAVIYTNLITLGLICLATIITTLFISHRLAGPLFRFEKELKEIGNGDLTTVITLRKRDQIKILADDLNQMSGNLHEKVSGIRNKILALSEQVSKQKHSKELFEGLKDLDKKIEDEFKLHAYS